MAEKKERRYSVDFEHFENAMLTEANLGWQLFMRDRFKLPKERREKVVGMLKRFVSEMKPELDGRKELMRTAATETMPEAEANPPHRHIYPNGD